MTPGQNSRIFFPVSTAKLIVMSIFSLGCYEFYWYYKNWQMEKARTGEDISPFWRAFFTPIFAYSLFKRIKEFGGSSLIPITLLPLRSCLGYIALTLAIKLPDPYWIIASLTFIPLLPVRDTIEAINLKHVPHADANGSFSGWNKVIIVLGGIILFSILVGLFSDS